MLEIIGITKRFGNVVALDKVDLTIADGERVAIVGRSGAGKSTLLRLINRLETVSAGTIRHKGVVIGTLKGAALRDWRRRCAMIFQQFNLVGRLDVQTNVLFGRLHRRSAVLTQVGWFPLDDRLAALAALDRLGLSDLALQRTETLSGGQQQRVSIARAMMQDPGIILADEPVSSLDPVNGEAVLCALRDLSVTTGATVICNIHAPDLALRYFDRIIGMASGRIVFDAPAASLSVDRLSTVYSE